MMSALKGVQGGLQMLMLLVIWVILSVNTKILLTDWRGQCPKITYLIYKQFLREHSKMTSSSYGAVGQPKVMDGKNYCYFVRRNCQKDDAGGGGQKYPKIR